MSLEWTSQDKDGNSPDRIWDLHKCVSYGMTEKIIETFLPCRLVPTVN